MEELVERLNKVSDSYFGFVAGVSAYVREDPSRLSVVNDYLNDNPEAMSSDILGFVMNRPDFLSSVADEACS